MDIEIDALLKLRAELNAKSAEGGAPARSSFRSTTWSSRPPRRRCAACPKVNASWTDDAMALYDDVDISASRCRSPTG
jgi:pyruvate dehydrogenase E2 component (dihydrolipoamide acetyltransferase)